MIFNSDAATNGLPVPSQQPASPSAQVSQVSGPSLSTRLGTTTPIGSGLSSEQAFWTTATITSGVISLAGAGLMMYAHGRHQDLLGEPDDELYNQRLRNEGSDIVGQNNAGVVMLAIGGGALMFSVYQLLTSPSAPASASSAGTSSALSVTPDPLNRSVNLEFTW